MDPSPAEPSNKTPAQAAVWTAALVEDPKVEESAKLCLDSWPSETVR